MEWLVIAALVVFGWHQTDSLKEQKEKAKYQLNLTIEAKMANITLEQTIYEYEVKLKRCNIDLNSTIDTVNNWREANAIQSKEIDRLKTDLGSVDYSDICRLPGDLDIETYRTARD